MTGAQTKNTVGASLALTPFGFLAILHAGLGHFKLRLLQVAADDKQELAISSQLKIEGIENERRP